MKMSKAQLLSALRAFYTDTRDALTSLKESLPASAAAVLDQQVSAFNTKLEALPADLKDDEDIAPMLLQAFQGVVADLRGNYTQLAATVKTELAALNGRVDAEVSARVGRGELVAKDAVKGLVQAARNEAIAEFKAEQARLDERKQLLATNGLPFTDEDVLAGDDAAFKARIDGAKPRLEQIKALAPHLPISGSLVKRALFGAPQEFEDSKALIELLKKPAGAGGPNPLARSAGGDHNAEAVFI